MPKSRHTFNNFNPHSPCGERRLSSRVLKPIEHISIHTPLAGSDERQSNAWLSPRDFNPHSPCGERRSGPADAALRPPISIHTPLAGSDEVAVTVSMLKNLFQSTLPLRGATAFQILHSSPLDNFNPHSPCGERRRPPASGRRLKDFNPHSPCGERRHVHS